MSVFKKLWNELFGRVVTSDRQKSQLVGILSHDLRNYLGAEHPLPLSCRPLMSAGEPSKVLVAEPGGVP
jgi:hypothetical protein